LAYLLLFPIFMFHFSRRFTPFSRRIWYHYDVKLVARHTYAH